MYAVDYEDLGTPPQTEGAPVTVEIDGQQVSVPDGTSIMRAAALAGVKVPKLCATDTLKAFGSCRLCLVEIEGRKGYPASCTTHRSGGHEDPHPVAEAHGAAPRRSSTCTSPITRSSASAVRPRATASSQDMAAVVGITETSYAAGVVHRPAKLDESNPYFTFDPELCIVCSRCVRACDETQGTLALTIQGRGFQSKVSASQDRAVHGVRVRLLRRLRRGLSDGGAHREVDHRARRGRARRRARPCAYCGVGCALQGRAARRAGGRRGGAHGARTATARPTTGTPASRVASPGATRPTRTASPSR